MNRVPRKVRHAPHAPKLFGGLSYSTPLLETENERASHES